jgi:hypothetical protein
VAYSQEFVVLQQMVRIRLLTFERNFWKCWVLEKDDAHLALPVTWDAAHALNLGVTGVKDSKEASGIHFRRFIKRCNVFNSLLANGKDFAYLQMIDQSAMRPVSYAAQRFASSSYEQWLKIEKGLQIILASL